MKAEAAPTNPQRAPKLRIPSWVPSPVARIARAAHKRNPSVAVFDGDHEWLTAFIGDQRMRNVWRELSRRHRGGAFMHPAAAVATVGADNRQGEAMAQLFENMVECRRSLGTTFTRGHVKVRLDHYLKMARSLTWEAAIIGGGLPNAEWNNRNIMVDERCRGLKVAADFYVELANKIIMTEMPAALERDTGDRNERWFALAIASKCQSLFGSPMYGLTATITSVAFGREFDPRTVRQWCTRPARQIDPRTVRQWCAHPAIRDA
jgi:hypothetical protein